MTLEKRASEGAVQSLNKRPRSVRKVSKNVQWVYNSTSQSRSKRKILNHLAEQDEFEASASEVEDAVSALLQISGSVEVPYMSTATRGRQQKPPPVKEVWEAVAEPKTLDGQLASVSSGSDDSLQIVVKVPIASSSGGLYHGSPTTHTAGFEAVQKPSLWKAGSCVSSHSGTERDLIYTRDGIQPDVDNLISGKSTKLSEEHPFAVCGGNKLVILPSQQACISSLHSSPQLHTDCVSAKPGQVASTIILTQSRKPAAGDGARAEGGKLPRATDKPLWQCSASPPPSEKSGLTVTTSSTSSSERWQANWGLDLFSALNPSVITTGHFR